MATSSPAEHRRVVLTPSRLNLTPDNELSTIMLDKTPRTGGPGPPTWRGSNASIAASPIDSPLLRRAAVNLLLGVPGDPSANDSISSWSADDQMTTDDGSSRASPTPLRGHSPEPPSRGRRVSSRYRNELWSSIRSDYKYLMDEEIIHACKSTETELSSDELSSESNVSYNEFLKQYKELTEWLGQLRVIVTQQAASHSENYLTHMYQEEMLRQSPRQQLFNDYARQLMWSYPQLKPEVVLRLHHVNEQWKEVTSGLVLPPGVAGRDTATMLADIREDVRALRDWVHAMENVLSSLHILSTWSVDKLREKLVEHQTIQRDIESRSRVVSAVLKLCDWLKPDHHGGGDAAGIEPSDEHRVVEQDRESVQTEAEGLKQRWHGVWIQSVEWQLRLEDAIHGGNRLRSLSYSDDEKVDLMRMTIPPGHSADSPDHRGNISAAALTPTSLDGSDIIPFNESEYEELGENELMLSYVSDIDETSAVLKTLGAASSWEAGLDSALGRSVSNPSLRFDVANPVPGGDEFEPTQPQTSGGHDVGYSSEGQSNEEGESPPGGKHGLEMPTVRELVLIEDASCGKRELESAGTSGIVTNTAVQKTGSDRRGQRESAVSSFDDTHLYSVRHQDLIGDETDDDFARLNELPLDDAPPTSELDLLAKLAATSADDRLSRMALFPGRSLDSLGPLHSERLFAGERRVSSVEIIVNSVASVSRASISRQISRDSAASENGHGNEANPKLLLPISDEDYKFIAPSSCDASSEGTISDSEFSPLDSSDSDGRSPIKSRCFTKRHRRAIRNSQSQSCTRSPIKSPTKRRLEIPAATNHLARSSSDGVIGCHQQPQDCVRVKRSKICRTMSDLRDKESPKKTAGSLGRRSDLLSPRKMAQLLRAAYRWSYTADESTDQDVPCAVMHGAASKSASETRRFDNYCISRESADDKDAVVPDVGGSLTSVTWNEEFMDVFDSGDRVDGKISVGDRSSNKSPGEFSMDLPRNDLTDEGRTVHKEKISPVTCALEDVCSQTVLSELHEAVRAPSDELFCLQRKCSEILERLTTRQDGLSELSSSEQELSAGGSDEPRQSNSVEELMDAEPVTVDDQHADGIFEQESVMHCSAAQRNSLTDGAASQKPAERPVKVTESKRVKLAGSSTLLRRMLKYSLPLPLLLIVVFGGLYLLCDSWHAALYDLGLLISPQLKHVRGAPPV